MEASRLIDKKYWSQFIQADYKDNKVNYVEYVPEVTHEPNYEKALEAIKKALA